MTANWEAEALIIVLNAIHGRLRQTQSHITLLTLAKIVIIVDYYNIHESLHITATAVFNDAATFQSITKVAIHRIPRYPTRLKYPVLPATLTLDRISQQQVLILDEISERLHEITDMFLSGKAGCNQVGKCKFTHIGALMQAMYDFKLMHHAIRDKHECSISIDSVLKRLKRLPSEAESCDNYRRSDQSCTLMLSDYLNSLLGRVTSKTEGLNLADFVLPSSEATTRLLASKGTVTADNWRPLVQPK
ncbi:hypothetical protein B0H63DRAFT_533470 [Podospora didyma]|uniref:Uncharacterized protein n=1 Tax=Podospora didyma TaxID=330526 RepID=A0AAE0P7X7_9PEZI|nr:hypothetical protein B0H63DRAFT_533470 [Podospora didyma]